MSENGSTEVKATNVLFDLRTVIGVLFAVYGVVCLVYGLVSYTDVDRERTGSINLNLWAGIGMLVIAAIFLAWSVLRPVRPAPATDADTSTGTDAETGADGRTGAPGATAAGDRPSS